ncbi:MAG: hypothetical protein K2K54_04510 [Lachnospiraceae bacterium]|nr:hypothetical protein [Lachnospiraceae bacterium]
MKEITKLENTSLSDFKLHRQLKLSEECKKRAFFRPYYGLGLFMPS